MQLLILGNGKSTAKWVNEQDATPGQSQFEINISKLADAEILFKSLHFDAVLYDISMPGNNVKETVKKLAVLCEKIPFIILTEVFTLPVAVEAVKLGADTYLLKDKAAPGLLSGCLNIVTARKIEQNKRFNPVINTNHIEFKI